MRNKTSLLVLTGLVLVLCLYYLSFTFISRGVEADATEAATSPSGVLNSFKKQAYLDSISLEPVFSLGFTDFTYKQAKENEVKLGLDLQGGMHVTMEVSSPDILRLLSNNNTDPVFNQSLEQARVAAITDRRSYTALFYEAFKKNAPNTALSSIFSNQTNKDLISYNSTDAQVLKYLDNEMSTTIERAFKILRTRIDKFGVTQPNIQLLQGTNRIQIELPGVDNPARVRKLLQGVAKLEFYEVWEGQEFNTVFLKINSFLAKEELAKKAGKKGSDTALPLDSNAIASNTNAAEDNSTASSTNANPFADSSKGDGVQTNEPKDSSAAALAGKDTAAGKKTADSLDSRQSSLIEKLFSPAIQKYGIFGVSIKDTAKVNRLFARPEIQALLPSNLKFAWAAIAIGEQDEQVLELYPIKKGREGAAPLEGDVITDARADFDERGRPAVSMNMNPTGARAWKRLTSQNLNRKIAIVLDNVVYSAPVVQGEIPNGQSSISGSFTVEQTKDMANILKAGKMPVPTRIVEEAVVGPTLGQESINKGLASIAAGFLTIILFMIAYYSGSGVVANIAVLLNIFLILGVMVPLDAVLTLPGIAGIVLTIGMAVDANVLINERIKDELRQGRDNRTAVANGYKAASTSIWDANLTTLIAAAVLLYFGSGPVQGFATTLIVGICTSLFTSVYLTRIIAEWWLDRTGHFNVMTSYTKNLFTKINIDFVAKRKIAYVFSTLFIVAGLVSMATQGFNYGVDFSGGWTYTVRVANPIDAAEVRTILTPYLQGAPEVKMFGSSDKLQITTGYLINDPSEDASEKVQKAVTDGLNSMKNNKFEVLKTAKVGPTIASDIRTSSIWAVVVATLGIFAFIWVRFKKWEYALGTTVALVHDTLVIMAVFSLFKDLLPFSLEVDQNFIAALLTIAGYSVNDTVVIFDRVREFFKDSTVDANPKAVVNKALNDTFSRTVITASTVFLVVLILLVFGGETIRGMSFALLIGVVSGTYSTIYIAVPFVTDVKRKQDAQIEPVLVTSAK